MYALSLNTTSSVLCLGMADWPREQTNLASAGSVQALGSYRIQTWDLGRELSHYLHQYLATFLAPQGWSDLSWLAVAYGPGSYTGTRIGLVTARILAQQLEIPLFGISTLAAIAQAYAKESTLLDSKVLIAVEMPAQRGSVYGGLYRWHPEGQGLSCDRTDQCLTIASWEEQLAAQTTDTHRIREGSAVSQENIKQENIDQKNIGRALLTLAHQQWQQGNRPPWQDILPNYG
ncbi:MAG: tRNA (adenosine(37)-N6)-threonylcarbamoyltransferase complex dimerization subunit type 1 TsaB [Acaryochloridaceae cyanobacterium SU_2_1]|nr:tRNA (adenosine(37)-N6)-threonylcarbamoyltransferase complex dimerization subunit type 1 TsaB [Acaryochloridaceae cyanobacterium SU_2_1]